MENNYTTVDSTFRVPENFYEYSGEDIMSNFDGLVMQETVIGIKGETLFSTYPGMNFYGKVWNQNDKWLCEVWCRGSYKETFVCDTPEEIMEEVSCKYGHE